MAAFYKYVFIIMIIPACLACTRAKKKRKEEPVNRNAGEAKVSMIRHNFLDSVAAGDELLPEQVKRNTMIDSVYYIGEARFTGDTLFYTSKKYPVAIIKYDDGAGCLNRFLLVYRTGGKGNADYTTVQTVCDQDTTQDYKALSYEITSDSSFYTKEQFHHLSANDTWQTTVTTQYFIINKEGMIEITGKEVTKP